MTSPSNETQLTPQDMLTQVIISYGALILKAKEEIETAHHPSTETLSMMSQHLGELIWLSGSINMAETMLAEEESLIEVVN